MSGKVPCSSSIDTFLFQVERIFPQSAGHFRGAIPNSQITVDSAIIWWVTDTPTTGEARLSAAANSLGSTDEGGLTNRHVVRSERAQPQYEVPLSSDSRNVGRRDPFAHLQLKNLSARAGIFIRFHLRRPHGRAGRRRYGLGGYQRNFRARARDTNGAACAAPADFYGDLINGYTTREDDFRAQLRSWKRIYGPLWREVPVYTGIGNHESLIDVFEDGAQADKQGEQSAEAVFASEFVHPMNGPEPERPGLPPYKGSVYSFDYAGCHFAQLNSDYWYSSRPQQHEGNPFGRLLPKQLDWLEKDLAAAQSAGARHLFVFVHEPAFPKWRSRAGLAVGRRRTRGSQSARPLLEHRYAGRRERRLLRARAQL